MDLNATIDTLDVEIHALRAVVTAMLVNSLALESPQEQQGLLGTIRSLVKPGAFQNHTKWPIDVDELQDFKARIDAVISDIVEHAAGTIGLRFEA